MLLNAFYPRRSRNLKSGKGQLLLIQIYILAIQELKDEGICSPELEHRRTKYMNNLIESDHGKLKRLIKPILGFKTMKTAYTTIKGFEVMRMFKKGQMNICKYGQGLQGQIRLINQQFNIYTV